ncbi:MAG: nitrite reductase large subunit NirB [Chloroflexota bacterium]
MGTKQQLVVIGNGMAGARFLEELLARGGGDQYEITVFGSEPYGNYNRILLSSVLAGSHDPQDIIMNPLDWYAANGITLHAGTPVLAIDRRTRTVYGAGQNIVPYDKLVFATGSSPFIPPFKGLMGDDGAFKPGAFAFRTLDDCDAIIGYAAGAKRAAVIGGGLLGLEAAKGLLNRGLEVHVVHLASHLMETQLDPTAGAILLNTLQNLGVHVYLGTATNAVIGDDRVTGLGFADGSSLECDMLVISTGIKPNIDLARQAGLSVERGIVVHNDLTCRNDPDIYAIGECAQHGGVMYGLVAPLWEQGRVLAEVLTNENTKTRYRGSRVSTKLKVMGVELAVMGIKEAQQETDEVVTYIEPSRGVYKKLIVREGQVLGAILLGDGLSAPRVLEAFDREESAPGNRAQLLFGMVNETEAPSLDRLPDEAQVCNCNGVTKGRLLQAVRGGARTLKTLCDATRAGTGCGSCKPQVQALLESASDGPIAEDPGAHYYVPGVPLTKPELIEAVRAQGLRSVSGVFAALAGGRDDSASKPGLASLLKTLWAAEYEDERDARFINDRVHANIQRDGAFSVVPRIYGGVTSPDQLRRIADVADRFNVPMVKITGGQRIDLLGVAKDDLPQVWQELGMPSGHAYTKAFRTCKTCVGTDFCRYGLGDSIQLGIDIEQRFQGIESPHKMKLAVSGCPRNCAEATTKDLGAVAIGNGRWEVLIGGAAGSQVRRGDVLCAVDSHEAVLQYMGRFMQYYRENAKYLERTYDFVARIGITRLTELLVEDAEGICARLDAEIQTAVDAYVDPWQEAERPVHPTQFAGVLEPAATGRGS